MVKTTNFSSIKGLIDDPLQCF